MERTKQIVEVDSKDVKFNETFSDYRDKKGKIIKSGNFRDSSALNLRLKAAEVFCDNSFELLKIECVIITSNYKSVSFAECFFVEYKRPWIQKKIKTPHYK